MTKNSTTGLYEATIPNQQANTLVKYMISAYDNAENFAVTDKSGQYYVYTVIPEFPSWTIIPLVFTATLMVTLYRSKYLKKINP